MRGQLESENPDDVAAAAEFLFERAHTSHLRSHENKEQMRRDGAIPVLFRALESSSRDARYHACSALSEMAFRNEVNCMAIAQCEDGLETIVAILMSDDLALKEDALLIVNNCAAFCEDVCTAIVSCPGMLDSLKALIHPCAAGASSVSVGAVNCLSRCKEVQDVLLRAGFAEALLPVLKMIGTGDKHHAHVARATMALANITAGGCAKMFGSDTERRAALGTTVTILKQSIKGDNWAGIHFAPYSVMYPLTHLATSKSNREVLVELGVADDLTTLIREWKTLGHQAGQTLRLALNLTENLCQSLESQLSLRSAGMMPVLENLADGSDSDDAGVMVQASRILRSMTEGHVAFFMGMHPRLGSASPLAQLDGLVMGEIARMAFGCAAITPLAKPVMHGSGGTEAVVDSGEDKREMILNAALARLLHSGQLTPSPGLRRMTTLL